MVDESEPNPAGFGIMLEAQPSKAVVSGFLNSVSSGASLSDKGCVWLFGGNNGLDEILGHAFGRGHQALAV